MRLQEDTAGREGGVGFYQMLLDLCFSMTLQYERAGSNPMLQDLGFGMRLLDGGRGWFNQMLLQLCFCMTLHDERWGGIVIQCSWNNAIRLQDDTA